MGGACLSSGSQSQPGLGTLQVRAPHDQPGSMGPLPTQCLAQVFTLLPHCLSPRSPLRVQASLLLSIRLLCATPFLEMKSSRKIIQN